MANKNLFTQVQMPKLNSNVFDLTHDFKFSANMGKLTPIMYMECVPGDKVTLSAESIIRYSPLIAPVMHRMDATIHYFFVPFRLLWDNWETFYTGSNEVKPGGGSDPTPVHPKILIGAAESAVGTLANYLGCPTITDNGHSYDVSAFPFAAYQFIFNEYYRDQNVSSEIDYKLVDGYNTDASLRVYRSRAWEHDYFTSALPWPQAGPSVDIPIAPYGDVPVKIQPTSDYPLPGFIETNGGAQPYLTVPSDNPTWQDLGDQSSMYAETSSLDAQPTTINELRRAFRLQEWFERGARAGRRFIEVIKARFNVNSSDKRLQRPEYITGIKTPIIVSEVLNTTGETDGLPQGNMAGHAIGVTTGKAGSYYVEEPGCIIGIMSVMPKTAYYQGVPKMFQQFDRFDYYWPEFANIGEQEVISRELYAEQYPADGARTFGYVPRYSQYKFMNSRIAGQFQTTLDYWHLARKFSSVPTLSQEFITSDPTTRIFAITDTGEDHLFIQVLNKIRAVRKMPYFGTPTF